MCTECSTIHKKLGRIPITGSEEDDIETAKNDFERMTIETLKTILCQGLSDKLESVFGSVFFVDESIWKEEGDFEDFVNGKTKERVTYQWRYSKVTGGLFLKLVHAPEEYLDRLRENWLLEWIWSGETKY